MRFHSVANRLAKLAPSRIVLAACVLSALAAAAQGYPVVLRATGHIEQCSDPAQLGGVFEGEFWSDTETPNQSSGFTGRYALDHWSLTYAGRTVGTTKCNPSEVLYLIDSPSRERLELYISSEGGSIKLLLSGTGTAFSGVAIPLGFVLDPLQFQQRFISYGGSYSNPSFYGPVDSLTITPEPGALLLMIVAGGLLPRRPRS
jgi:hypothetical protein